MIKLKDLILENDSDYRGNHSAPDKEVGYPLYDVTGVWQDDIYGPDGARFYGHYGHGDLLDVQSVNIIKHYRNRPNASVVIYRAVPKNLNPEQERIKKELRHMYKVLRKVGPFGNVFQPKIDELEKQLAELPNQKIQINPGDWVTINRKYAEDHGRGQLGGYKILRKTVPAKHIFTFGDSIHEWGYDPS